MPSLSDLASQLAGRLREGPNRLALWRRAMYAAAAARVLGARAIPPKAHECAVAALLTDLGTLIVDWQLDRPAVPSDGAGLRFGCIQSNDAYAPEIAKVLALAGHCADIFICQRPAHAIAQARRELLAYLALGEQEADDLLCQVSQEARELAALFKVPLNPAADYRHILENSSQRLLECSLLGEGESEHGNQRRAARLRRGGQITIIPITHGIRGPGMEVILQNISARGIGIIHSSPLQVASRFVVPLMPERGVEQSISYAVLRCDRIKGRWSIGAKRVPDEE